MSSHATLLTQHDTSGVRHKNFDHGDVDEEGVDGQTADPDFFSHAHRTHVKDIERKRPSAAGNYLIKLDATLHKRNTLLPPTFGGVMTLDGALTYPRTSTVAVVAPTPLGDENSFTSEHPSNEKLRAPALPLYVGGRRDLHLSGATSRGGTLMKQAEGKQTVFGKFRWWLCTPYFL